MSQDMRTGVQEGETQKQKQGSNNGEAIRKQPVRMGRAGCKSKEPWGERC